MIEIVSDIFFQVSNDSAIEEGLLEQIRVVQKDVPIVIFCHNIPFIWRIGNNRGFSQ